MSYKIMDFTKTFPTINLDLMKTDEKGYDYTVLLLYIGEYNKGFKVKRINKTTKKGTSVVYETINDAQDFEEYKGFITNKINKFNSKWNESLQLN